MKLALALTMAVALLSCKSNESISTHKRYPAQYGNTQHNMNCNEYFGHLRKQRPSTVKQALNLVRKKRPKFMTQHTFAYDSHSLHGSSFENPRAIVFGGDAKMILTFNGKSGQGGYERLEVMCFNDKNKTFEFRDIAFPKEAKNPEDLEDIPKHLRNEPFVISPKNGHPDRDCKQCHGTPVRPNWHPYNLWPGICGADGDEYYISKGRPGNNNKGNHGPNYKDVNSVEEVGCDQFFDGNFKKGRYAELLPGEKVGTELDPNFRLNVLLNKLNGERITEEWKRRGRAVKDIKYQIAEALFCTYPKFTDESKPYHKRNLMPKPLDPLALEYLRSNHKQFTGRLKQIEAGLGKKGMVVNGDAESEKAAKFFSEYYGIKTKNPLERWALYNTALGATENLMLAKLSRLFTPLGFDVSNWSMATLGGYSFKDGMGGAYGNSLQNMLQRPFVENYLPEEGKLKELVHKLEYNHLSNYGESDGLSFKQIEVMRKEMCDIVKPKADLERKKGGVTNSPTQKSDAVER